MGVLTVVWAVVRGIGAAIAAVLAAIPPVGWLIVVCLGVGIYLGHTTGCNFGCRPPREVTRAYEVDSVPTGASIEVKIGLLDRRTLTVSLADVAAPDPGDPQADASRANLERLAGTTIRVQTTRSRLLGEEAGEADLPEARHSIVGVVYGESGCCLNLEQVRAGLARCNATAAKEWQAVESQAKKQKLGIWQSR